MAELKVPSELRYTKNDEWLRVEGETGTAGITDYAQDQLNDIVYVEFPDVGAELAQGAAFGVVESVKAASDIYMPVGGTITEVNTALEDEPEAINTDPYGNGWLVRFTIKNPAEIDGLMDAEAYKKYCESR
jgi:glycine cleavage system H protein